MQAKLGVVPGRQHDAEQRGPAVDQELELGEPVGRAQFVQIVDDQRDRLLERAELGDETAHNGFSIEIRRRRQLLEGDAFPDGLL